MVVGSFYVAQFLLKAQSDVEAFGKNWFRGKLNLIPAGGQTFEFHSDKAVVARSSGKNFAGEFKACGQRSIAIGFKFGSDAIVIGRIGNDGDAFQIFWGGAQHGRAADINVLD